MPKDQTVTTDEWLAALDAAFTEAGPDGISVQEIATRLGVTRGCISRRIRQAIDRGEMEFVGRKAATRMDGVPCSVPAYRSVKGGGG